MKLSQHREKSAFKAKCFNLTIEPKGYRQAKAYQKLVINKIRKVKWEIERIYTKMLKFNYSQYAHTNWNGYFVLKIMVFKC